jgi:hypothetical protein
MNRKNGYGALSLAWSLLWKVVCLFLWLIALLFAKFVWPMIKSAGNFFIKMRSKFFPITVGFLLISCLIALIAIFCFKKIAFFAIIYSLSSLFCLLLVVITRLESFVKEAEKENRLAMK